jgi:hypothetical protein
MNFKRNLLKKIEIDEMTRKVMSTLGTVDSGLRIDKETMRRLLETGPYEHLSRRDLDLYIDKTGTPDGTILVLDNELPIYRTTEEDVVMRRSPTVKEMLNIRNAIKILKDADVRVSGKEASLKTVRKTCIDQLDLSFNKNDITEIENEGIRSLEKDYAEGVVEAVMLFSELLDYNTLPKVLQLRHHEMAGKFRKDGKGGYHLAPVVMYNRADGTLKLVTDELSGTGKKIAEKLAAVSSGEKEAPAEGADAFHSLAASIKIRPIWPESEPIF